MQNKKFKKKDRDRVGCILVKPAKKAEREREKRKVIE